MTEPPPRRAVFSWFESLSDPVGPPPAGAPPAQPRAFYWRFVGQMRGHYGALVLTGLVVALLDTAVPLFIGQVAAVAAAQDRAAALDAAAWDLALMALALLVVRPLAQTLDAITRNSAVAPAGNSLVRWQSHWHVVRQSWSFFQADFAGRVANRVMQVGHALRESVIAAIRAVWHIAVFGVAACGILLTLDPWLAPPLLAWAVGYGLLLRWFVPRLHGESRAASAARSHLMGRIVDSYANIQTVKLFAEPEQEDAHVRDGVLEHLWTMQKHNRVVVGFGAVLWMLNAALIVAMGAAALLLWREGRIEVGAVATALPLALMIANMAGWVAFELAGIFENVGVVQESMETVAQPIALVDRPDAAALVVARGEVRFEAARFGYGRPTPVLDGLDLVIAPGERLGLVGRSGAGKSTLVHLLLRFHDLEGGRILIDGQNVADVTQASLRRAIGMVTQDVSLLHRSIAENIRYGRPDASAAEIVRAAQEAEAHDFIVGLEDWKGRTGYDAHVGERGVKLSGGQRQRIALARVILKDAPILILDEATSALDSEVEAAIQRQLERLMAGKTVIAIAHRLSTIARMDRLAVIDGGRVAEQGTHAQLIAAGGIYADLWARQSGGFLADQAAPGQSLGV